MYRAVLLSLVLLVGMGGVTALRAKLIPYRKLSTDQRVALQESEKRLGTYDRALQAIELARKKGRISRMEYGYEAHDLTAFIGAEARFQNEILISDQPFPPEDAREVMENIAKYTILVPAYILEIAAKGLAGSSYTFH
jgi:hypothetical protein